MGYMCFPLSRASENATELLFRESLW